MRLIIANPADWIETEERSQNIQFDINSTPLQIYTDSEIGSGDIMWVQFLTDSENGAGISVRFDETPNYHIGGCTTNRPKIQLDKLGEDNDRIWTIEKHGTRLKLLCNGVEIFDYDTQTSNENDCKNRWSIDFTRMRFADYTGTTINDGLKDTASDLYRKQTTGKYPL